MSKSKKHTGKHFSFRRLLLRLKGRIVMNRRKFILYSILRILVLITMVRCFIIGEYENVGLCLLALLLFLIPSLAEESLNIQIPFLFEAIIYLFIYAAWILGEIQNYYILIPGWDTMLHTMNGFLCAAVGFSLVDLLNQRREEFHLSPVYVTIVAFCFSMTVGVIWEFVEFTFDELFYLDMQKDTIVRTIGTLKLTGADSQWPLKISDITRTVITTSSGKTVTISGGYLDIGLVDTMKDLFVNFIGALAFSIIGYNYIAKRQEGSIAQALQIRRETPEEAQRIDSRLDSAQNLTYLQAKSLEASELISSVSDSVRRDRGLIRSDADKKTESSQNSSPADSTKQEQTKGAAGTMKEPYVLLQYRIVITAWIAALLCVAGIFTLYPIGSTIMNILFLVVKTGMLAGLLIFLLTRKTRRQMHGLWIWTLFSIGSCLLSVYRLTLLSSLNSANVRMYLLAIAMDLLLPVILWKMYRAQLRNLQK